jgi:hypothetical protein
MGFNYEQYKEELSNATGELASVSSADPYAYATGTMDDYNYTEGTMDDYNYAGGCGWLYPFNKERRNDCEQKFEKRRETKLNLKVSDAESNKMLSEAAALKSSKTESNTQMSPLAITGIIVGSLLAITVMVVVIKKVNK